MLKVFIYYFIFLICKISDFGWRKSSYTGVGDDRFCQDFFKFDFYRLVILKGQSDWK